MAQRVEQSDEPALGAVGGDLIRAVEGEAALRLRLGQALGAGLAEAQRVIAIGTRDLRDSRPIPATGTSRPGRGTGRCRDGGHGSRSPPTGRPPAPRGTCPPIPPPPWGCPTGP